MPARGSRERGGAAARRFDQSRAGDRGSPLGSPRAGVSTAVTRLRRAVRIDEMTYRQQIEETRQWQCFPRRCRPVRRESGSTSSVPKYPSTFNRKCKR